MKKILLIMAILVGQLFAMDDGVPASVGADAFEVPALVPLTARFITAADLLGESPIHANIMRLVGA